MIYNPVANFETHPLTPSQFNKKSQPLPNLTTEQNLLVSYATVCKSNFEKSNKIKVLKFSQSTLTMLMQPGKVYVCKRNSSTYFIKKLLDQLSGLDYIALDPTANSESTDLNFWTN